MKASYILYSHLERFVDFFRLFPLEGSPLASSAFREHRPKEDELSLSSPLRPSPSSSQICLLSLLLLVSDDLQRPPPIKRSFCSPLQRSARLLPSLPPFPLSPLRWRSWKLTFPSFLSLRRVGYTSRSSLSDSRQGRNPFW